MYVDDKELVDAMQLIGGLSMALEMSLPYMKSATGKKYLKSALKLVEEYEIKRGWKGKPASK